MPKVYAREMLGQPIILKWQSFSFFPIIASPTYGKSSQIYAINMEIFLFATHMTT